MVKIQFTLNHAALTSSGMGRESFQVKGASPAIPGMYRLILRVEGTRLEVTMDAVTAHNLGAELMSWADGYLRESN